MSEISQTSPIARKSHKCIWCGEEIVVGERYQKKVVVFGGSFDSQTWHGDCFETANQFYIDNPDEDIIYAYECKRGSTEHR